MIEPTVIQINTDNFDINLLKSNMVLVVGSSKELESFYHRVIPSTFNTTQGSVVTFTLCDEVPPLTVNENKFVLSDYDSLELGDREEAESKYLEDIVEYIEKIRVELPDENCCKSYTIVFFADFWNMLERKILYKSNRKLDDSRKDYGCHSPLIERLMKLCLIISKCKNVKFFIFRDEYNTAKYSKYTPVLTDLELSCTERVFLSFGNTLNISVLSQELAEYLPDAKPLDVCYNLSGGKIGYIQKVAAAADETVGSLEKYVIEFMPQHYVEARLIDKMDLNVSVIVDDGVSGTQKESIGLYSPLEKIISIIDESEDPYNELKVLISDGLDHKQLLDATAIKDPIKRQQKITKFKSPEVTEYTEKLINAVTEVLIKLLAPPMLGSKRQIAIIDEASTAETTE